VQYLSEIRVGQTVAVYIRVLGRSPKRLHFMEFMVNESSSALSSTMEVLCAHADLRVRRTSPFPSDLAERLDAIIEDHQRLDWEAPVCGIIRP
jgi:acyl-CoA thioester hydrolase